MENILNEIRMEREYQDKRWGHVVDDTLNTPWMWSAYIAAICVAAIESIDRQRSANSKTFYEE